MTASNPAALLAADNGLRMQVKPDQRYASLTALGNQAQVWVTSEAAVKWDVQVVYTEPLANAEQGSFTAELAFSEKPLASVPAVYQEFSFIRDWHWESSAPQQVLLWACS